MEEEFKTLVRHCQEEEFSKDIKRLARKQPLHRKSRLIQLSPFLDEDSIIAEIGVKGGILGLKQHGRDIVFFLLFLEVDNAPAERDMVCKVFFLLWGSLIFHCDHMGSAVLLSVL